MNKRHHERFLANEKYLKHLQNFSTTNKEQYHVVGRFGGNKVWQKWVDKDFGKRID